MQYKKYEGVAYNLHIIKTDKFKTVTVRVDFRGNLEKKDTTYRNLLTKMLLESSKNYPNKRLLAVETENLYNLGFSASNSLSGDAVVTSMVIKFLNEKYTEEGMNDKSIAFLFDVLFNPNVIDGKFDSNGFNLAKNKLATEIKSAPDDPASYSTIRSFEELDKGSISYRSCGYMEDLEKIDEKSLYNYYVDMLRSNMVDIYVIGDVEIDKINSYFRKEFTINTLKRKVPTHFITHKRFKSRFRTVKEKVSTNQSNLVMIYKLKDLTPFEQNYVLPIYSYILGGGPDSRLFKNVREKNSLCYGISSRHLNVYNILMVKAGINAKDFKKAVALIKKEVKELSKGSFDETDLFKAKNTYLSSYKEILDSPKSILNTYAASEYLGYDSLPEREQKIITVTEDMVLKVALKVHPDLIFLLEGDEK